MKFTMTVRTDGAAFDDPAELARIVEAAAVALRDGYPGGVCLDVNGNVVGSWENK